MTTKDSNVPDDWSTQLTKMQQTIIETLSEKMKAITDEQIPKIHNDIRNMETKVNEVESVAEFNRDNITEIDKKLAANEEISQTNEAKILQL